MVIVLLTACFGVGGAEKVLSQMANNWAACGHKVSAVSIASTNGAYFFPFHDAVEVVELDLATEDEGLLKGITNNCRRLRELRTTFIRMQPDIVISFLSNSNVLAIVSLLFTPIPVIVTERSDPTSRQLGRAWNTLRKLTYPHADAVVCLGSRPLAYFSGRVRGHIIPNSVCPPVELANIDIGNPEVGTRRTVVGLGRLVKEKCFENLIAAFSQLCAKHPDWDLVIWGEGTERVVLEKACRELLPNNRVSLPGATHVPVHHLAEADLFVLSSRVEGFPNVLTEAMSIGLPVVATDVGAVNEIVRHGIDGLVVPPLDVTALANAMDHMMGSQEERSRLGGRARDVVERFSESKIAAMWESLIEAVTEKPMALLNNVQSSGNAQ